GGRSIRRGRFRTPLPTRRPARRSASRKTTGSRRLLGTRGRPLTSTTRGDRPCNAQGRRAERQKGRNSKPFCPAFLPYLSAFLPSALNSCLTALPPSCLAASSTAVFVPRDRGRAQQCRGS